MATRNYRLLFWFGGAMLLLVLFFEITDETVGEGSLEALDLAILRKVAEWRTPLLTIVFTNFTALGSTTLITVHSVIALSLLLATRDRYGALQLGAASGGAWLLTQLAKDFLGRQRPTAIAPLIDAFGFSYPSGHALSSAAMYVTIAILACRHLRLLRQRILLGFFTVLIVSTIALSRVYLGVHYATDILSGLFLGTAWALLLAGIFAALEQRAKS